MFQNLKYYSDIQKLITAITSYGGEIRFVGGCVRDALLNIQIQDIDFATNLLPDDIEKALEKSELKSFPSGKEFGTVSAIINKRVYEITTLRKDIKSDGRKPVVKFSDNWKEDAARRDFTINALSYDQVQDKLYDYFNGEEHLRKGIVKFVGDPEERVKEDYLRILRYYRFYAVFGKIIDEASIEACKKYASYINGLSGERKFSEFAKIVASGSWFKIITLLFEDRVLEHLLGCAVRTKDLEILKTMHNHDYKINAVLVLYMLSDRNFKDIAITFRLSNNQRKYMQVLYECQQAGDKLSSNPKQYIYKYGHEVYFDALKIISASSENFADYQEIHSNFNAWKPPKFPLNGTDIKHHFKIPEGKLFGEILQLAEKIWLESDMSMSKQQLLHALAMKSKLRLD